MSFFWTILSKEQLPNNITIQPNITTAPSLLASFLPQNISHIYLTQILKNFSQYYLIYSKK
ncbi:hypothetical protein HFN_0577 [Helicobacter fennelliae MRY12-0050]|uniref:Uncharacterized protein n=1 Tax=Helicobacter fennelliae MRY12-0050 TaxID=1325130 RepID=T1D2L9_9HELI|nr:hypothetical protein HFN_0577 [Helicobacter fennelliae MRY12-0050]